MSRLRADRRVGLLLAGTILLSFVSLGATVALPLSDPEVREVEPSRSFDSSIERGMTIYRNEGCWYCHTQQVREGRADTAFGEPVEAGAYAHQDPSMLGVVRVGPDLSHVGSRYTDPDELISVLTDPRQENRRSVMPAYDYLSTEDLEALAAYLLSLE